MPENNRLVDLIPVSRRRRGRSPRKVLRSLRGVVPMFGTPHVQPCGEFRNQRRQERADRKGVA